MDDILNIQAPAGNSKGMGKETRMT